jgi:hypothetical protein
MNLVQGSSWTVIVFEALSFMPPFRGALEFA